MPKPKLPPYAVRVRAFRAARGLTLRGLAELANLSHQTVDWIEKGKYDPKLSTLAALADALDVDVGELLATDPVK